MSKWNLIINVGRCLNCNNCVIAERDEHTGNDFPGYAAPASLDAASPIRILRRVQGFGHMVEAVYLPVMCNHCDNAPCMKVGGDAISKRPDGLVIIDPVKARGRRDIVASCPYRAIVWNEAEQVPQNWIFDAHLLDQGWKQPRCQQSCPTGVFEAVRLNDAAMAAKAEKEGLKVLHPHLKAKPRVWYRGLEKWETCFIGGSVSATTPQGEECVADADVWLFRDGTCVANTRTDHFGDFRFGNLSRDSGDYRIEVGHACGTASHTCRLGESVYVGELKLSGNPINSTAVA